MGRLPVCVLLLCSGTVAFDFDDEEIAGTDGGAPGAAGSTEHAGAVGKSVELEHRLGDGPFASRGKLFYRYISGVGGLVASARVVRIERSSTAATHVHAGHRGHATRTEQARARAAAAAYAASPARAARGSAPA